MHPCEPAPLNDGREVLAPCGELPLLDVVDLHRVVGEGEQKHGRGQFDAASGRRGVRAVCEGEVLDWEGEGGKGGVVCDGVEVVDVRFGGRVVGC